MPPPNSKPLDDRQRELLLALLAAVAPTPDNQLAYRDAVKWRGSESDVVTDLLAAIRKRAGIE